MRAHLVIITIAALSSDAVAKPTTLSLADALDLAEQLQPSAREAMANHEAAVARVDVARVVAHPTLAVAGTATLGRAAIGTANTNASSDATVGTAIVSAQASWRLCDFGQTAATVRAAKLTATATASAVVANRLDIRLSVEVAYLEAVARRRLTQVAEATIVSEQRHVEQAARFVEAGAQDPIALAQAKARLANARSALAQATSNEANALASLRAAIGVVDLTRAIAVEPAWPTRATVGPSSLPVLVETARAHRPELAQLEATLAGADATVVAARAERRPVLTAQAATTWSHDTQTSMKPTWSIGLTLTAPIFDGGKATADTHVAHAQLAQAIAQRDQLLVTLTSQLESARDQVAANRENVRASQEAVTAARAQLALSDARYAQGIGSQIELADAQTAVTTAEGNLVAAQWQLATAWAQLDRAIGAL
jgi:outer membrane protein